MDESKYLIKDEMSQLIIQTARKIAEKEGAKQVTVRKILKDLNISNRVFYNRFKNIEEVLSYIYKNVTKSLQLTIDLDCNTAEEYYDLLVSVPIKTLKNYYKKTEGLEQLIFEKDSHEEQNITWWHDNITQLLQYGVNKGYLKEFNVEAVSYIIWCFVRSFYADVVVRNIPVEDAESIFNLGFKIFLEGLKPAD